MESTNTQTYERIYELKNGITPIRNNILVRNINFEESKSLGGIILLSDDGKDNGIRPRWGEVYATGPDQKEVKAGDWVYIEHGRWSRGIPIKDADGNEFKIRRVDPDGIMLVGDEPPNDARLSEKL